VEESKLYTARVQVVEAMEQGLPWYEAAKRAELSISQSTVYRLRQRMRQGGEQALREGRHGHLVNALPCEQLLPWNISTCPQS
jgi:transposase